MKLNVNRLLQVSVVVSVMTASIGLVHLDANAAKGPETSPRVATVKGPETSPRNSYEETSEADHDVDACDDWLDKLSEIYAEAIVDAYIEDGTLYLVTKDNRVLQVILEEIPHTL